MLPTPRRVGIIGIGRMGMPMCARLVEQGFAVRATDRRVEAHEAVTRSGAQWCHSVADVAAESEVVITVLPGPTEVVATLDGVIAGMTPGSTWIEMSSATPAVAREIAAAVRGRDLRTLDSPVGGGPAQARDGRLLAFVGGSAEDLDAQSDILGALTEQVLHVGEGGSGYVVKLLVNLLWFGQAIAGAEALSLAARTGLDPETVRQAVQASAAANRFMASDAPTLMRGENLTSFSLARCHEELCGVLALGDQLGVPLGLGERIAEFYAAALQRYGDVDGELLGARLVADRAGVDLTPWGCA